jgi:hypothetical protein
LVNSQEQVGRPVSWLLPIVPSRLLLLLDQTKGRLNGHDQRHDQRLRRDRFGADVRLGTDDESGGNFNADTGIDLLGGGYIADYNSVVSDGFGISVFAQTTITKSGLIHGGR